MRASILAVSAFTILCAWGVFASPARVPIPDGPQANQRERPPIRAEAAPAAAAAGATPAPVAPPPSAVVSVNGSLSHTVEWQFGGKTQRGWYLYVPLIQRLIGSDADPHSPEFSDAVARWQKASNLLPADGVLNASCWLTMMGVLQQARTRDSVLCPPEELIEVPAEQWFDRERAPELRCLRRDAYDAYQRMVAAARAELGAEASGYFAIISGYRSPEYQEKLRAQAGNPSTASLARKSPHFTGRAIDLYVGGEPVSTADANRAIQVATPAYKWLARNAHRFGFRPYFYEPWHWEYDPRLARAGN